jgi:hypothetical protein
MFALIYIVTKIPTASIPVAYWMNFLKMYDFTVLILRVRIIIYIYYVHFKVANVSLMPIKKNR